VRGRREREREREIGGWGERERERERDAIDKHRQHTDKHRQTHTDNTHRQHTQTHTDTHRQTQTTNTYIHTHRHSLKDLVVHCEVTSGRAEKCVITLLQHLIKELYALVHQANHVIILEKQGSAL
jgi:hypothetical protein